MTTTNFELPGKKWGFGLFMLSQIAIMLLAISNESLWIDEFWNAYFSTMDSIGSVLDLLLVPSGSQTPLHFLYGYLWAQFVEPSELGLRLSNLPLFVMAQLSLFCALRAYPRKFACILLALCALHPMVWQYANEARPYIMMYSGSIMILAYLLHLHAAHRAHEKTSTLFTAIFAIGSILLFGASMLGVFWVFSACLYIAYFHYKTASWRYLTRGADLLLILTFVAIASVLTIYYVDSVLHGGGASKLSGTTVPTLLFDAYELLGLSGIGPGRLQLRGTGMSALGPFLVWLIPAVAIILATLAAGAREAVKQLRTQSQILFLVVLGLLPIGIIVLSGFVMHWRVLGRHMIPEIPLLNLLFALGLTALFQQATRQTLKRVLGVAFLAVMVYSSCSLRVADRHRKDDYRAAASLAINETAAGKRVWWAADAIGARYYRLPGEFDYMAELTSRPKPFKCADLSGVMSVSPASAQCLETLAQPDTVILSKPETFDKTGAITAYLNARRYVKVQELPAFTVWRSR